MQWFAQRTSWANTGRAGEIATGAGQYVGGSPGKVAFAMESRPYVYSHFYEGSFINLEFPGLHIVQAGPK